MDQIISITWQNLLSLSQRRSASIVAIVGVAGVVAVFVAVLSMARGFERTLESGGSENNVIFVRSGSSSELDSGLSGPQADIIEEAPGIARDEQGPVFAAEVYTIVDVAKRTTGTTANLPFRGVSARSAELRSGFELIEGRMFETGRKELIAGVGAQDQFAGVEVGQTLEFGTERWDVVGVFRANGGIAESELWADVLVTQGAFNRGNSFSSAYARLESPGEFQALVDSLSDDPRLSLNIRKEREYFSEQSEVLSVFIKAIGYGIAALMALGAVFGALNTMYTAVSDRGREIATLRALGFSRVPIVISVLVEALVLALVGGLLGGLISWLMFNGYTVSTLNFASFTQVVFAFAVTPDLLVAGILMALIIGLIGGVAPAIHAARLPIATALRG